MPLFGKKKEKPAEAGAGAVPASPEAEAGVQQHAEKMHALKSSHDDMQMRTFTRWWNSVLAPRGLQVEVLTEDLKNGVLPIALYEILSNELVKRHVKKPTTRFHNLENNNVFLAQLKAKGIRLVNIAGEDIVDGNKTLLLGLTWTLILRYEIQKYGADEQELLRWVKECTRGYKGVAITNWTQSFNDGLAFGALIDKHRPELLSYSSLQPSNPMANLETVFNTADDKLGVPKLLDAADLTGGGPIDDRSIITYVAKMRQAFLDQEADMRRRMQEEEAARLREERLAKQRQMAELAKDLQNGAAALSKWMRAKKDNFTESAAGKPTPAAALGATVVETEAKLRELREGFRGEEKPPKAEEKARLADLYAKVKALLLADAMGLDDAEAKAAAADVEARAAAGEPDAIQGDWKTMEAAEGDYEAALLARRAQLEAEAAAAETDGMLGPLEAGAKDLLAWCGDQTARMETKIAAAPGLSNEDATAGRKALGEWNSADKPPKEEDKVGLQRGLREVAQRRAQEGREAPPGLDADLDQAWSALEAAAKELDDALNGRQKDLAKKKAEKETDDMAKDNDEKAAAWLAAVKAKDKDFRDRVQSGSLGSSAEEAEKLLKELRDGYQKQERPQKAAEKTALEGGRREVDGRRLNEGREPAAWTPPNEALGDAWTGCGDAERDYEQALLERMGKLAEEEADRLKKAALRQKGLDTLAQLLPPFMDRQRAADDAAKAGAAAAERARELKPWADEQCQKLEAQLEQLKEGNTPGAAAARLIRRSSTDQVVGKVVRAQLADLETFAADDKHPKQQELLDALAKGTSALAGRQLQRAGPNAKARQEVADVDGLKTSWNDMEAAEAALRGELLNRLKRLEGAALEFERLQRGVKQVGAWVGGSREAIDSSEVPQTEEAASRLLHAAEQLRAELDLQVAAVARLQPLAARLAEDVEFGARATDAIAQVAGVPSMVTPVGERVKRLGAEVERLRRLETERRRFEMDLIGFAAALADAEELAGFPVDTLDTVEALEAIKSAGAALATRLLPAPEGAAPEAIRRAEELLETWGEVNSALDAREKGCEAAHRAQLIEEKLFAEYAAATTSFDKWHDKTVAMIKWHGEGMTAGGSLEAASARRGAELLNDALIEGSAHQRSAETLVRQMTSHSLEMTNPSTVSLAALSLKMASVRSLADGLNSGAQLAPPKLENAPVIKALQNLAEGSQGEEKGFGKAMTGMVRRLSGKLNPPLAVGVVEQALPAEQSAYLKAELLEANGDLDVDTFDPFPADRSDFPVLDLPATAGPSQALAIVEHINQARAHPAVYARQLKHRMTGCFEGNVFTPPWSTSSATGGASTPRGVRQRTAEGEGAVTDLALEMEAMAGKPVLRLVDALSEVAQQLADALAKGSELGSAGTSLTDRIASKGTYSGVAGEAVAYGVQAPEAVAAQLLLADGDKDRRNRKFLLNGELKVAGVGFADHPKFGSVCVITLVTLFAVPLAEPLTVECQGTASEAFQRVVDAIPSDQARTIATDALVTGKKVAIEYEPGKVMITVHERDGSQHSSSLKWA